MEPLRPPERCFPLLNDPSDDQEYADRLRIDEEENQRMLDTPDNEWKDYDRAVLDAKLDECPSPKHKKYPFWTPEYEARRRASRPLISPPTTPRITAKRKRESTAQSTKPTKWQKPQMTPSEICKAKRRAPRRPRTRSMGVEEVVLHPQKRGKVMKWLYKGKYAVMSYERYLKDYVSRVP